MASYISAATNNIETIVKALAAEESIDVRLALVEYRDHPPQDETFVSRYHDFTNNVKEMKSWLQMCSASGGGDTPEAVADGLNNLIKLNWRPRSTKIAILISDAPPHGLSKSGDGFPNGCPVGLDPLAVVRKLAGMMITLYVVGCEPSLVPYKEFFTGLAYATGGQYVPLAGANALTQIIIGGAKEEMSLDKWMDEINEEIMEEFMDGDDIDEEEITSKIHSKMAEKGYKTKKLTRNAAGMGSVSGTVKAISKMSNLSEVASAPASEAVSISDVAHTDVYDCVEDTVDRAQVERMVKKSVARNKELLSDDP